MGKRAHKVKAEDKNTAKVKRGAQKKGGYFREIADATLSASPRRITDAYLGNGKRGK